ncbi:hypothetical protein KUL25_19825 [Rhodobacteraceae bacterium N5(2021)]|uniref:Uncharacterized protein n=1 Tax=Gymnodinialimonas phycosphaerae TaxID=2841589 RepID=A0A975YFP3_9RHOB|nr:hypothetical protein [Gymnodinialimonas phycosphaerae]MBY4895014.1 hypothetical protein [Gymnodinialimonas phycosphaerae]
MIRLALILSLIATPVLADTVPMPRPDGLVERARAAAQAAAEAEAEAEAGGTMVAQAAPPDRAAIAAQISEAIRACWNVGALSEEAMAVSIRLGFDTTPEGEVIRESIEMLEFSNGTQDAAEEALVQAFAAIMRCGNDGLDLPSETHPIWQRIEMTFDAGSVATR